MTKRLNIRGLICMALLMAASAAHAGDWDIGVGFRYSSGGNQYPQWGAPIGYGNGYGALGAGCGGVVLQPVSPCLTNICSACTSCGNLGQYSRGPAGYGLGGPGGIAPPPAMPPIPPPAPVLPPHLTMPPISPPNGGLGNVLLPGAATGGVNCVPCQLGMQIPYSGPVMGGPVSGQGYGYGLGYGHGGESPYRARNEWEKNDTADIVFATGIGLGMQASNVFPVAVPRYQPTITPGWFSMGERDSTLVPRPHYSP